MKKDDHKNILIALSYPLWPLALVVLIIEETKKQKQQDHEVRHHAYNALGFAVAVLILSIPVAIIGFVPFLGHVIVALYWIAVVVFAIIFAIRAYNGEKVVIPFTTDFLKKHVKGF